MTAEVGTLLRCARIYESIFFLMAVFVLTHLHYLHYIHVFRGSVIQVPGLNLAKYTDYPDGFCCGISHCLQASGQVVHRSEPFPIPPQSCQYVAAGTYIGEELLSEMKPCKTKLRNKSSTYF
jgi:hypothetical protein